VGGGAVQFEWKGWVIGERWKGVKTGARGQVVVGVV
jgi:hypothetical protein